MEGSFCSLATIPLLRSLGVVVWLTASEEVIWERVSRNQNRPLLRTKDPRTTITNLLSIRYPLYRAVADINVETSGLTHQEVADRARGGDSRLVNRAKMKTAIRTLAKQSGFDDCRFARAVQAPHATEYFSWLQSGHHGEMTWLSRDPARRADPARVLVDAKTLLVLATNYFQGGNPRQPKGKIARYAWGDDYHQIMLQNMVPIDTFLRENGGRQKCYVDTGPILERDFAATAGLSWQGKSTMCLNERLGTWFFIGVILTTLEFRSGFAGPKPVWLLYPLYRCLPNPGHYPSLPIRRSPLYLLPHD